ncbi:MAG: type II toxin-antitoxin system RelE/ParE family toxin [Kiritimatiellia bacterium]|jgi:plasmid stabilization system protein ParE
MAFKIIWSNTAGENLKEIVFYIGLDNPDAAACLAARILSRIEIAAQYPLSLRVAPEKNSRKIREALLNPYCIVFAVDEKRGVLHVLRIWHAARGIPEIEEI